jgi:hypothetical protein
MRGCQGWHLNYNTRGSIAQGALLLIMRDQGGINMTINGVRGNPACDQDVQVPSADAGRVME